MKKALLLMLLIIALNACVPNQGTETNNWRTGTEGIAMGFVSENPPSEILSNQEADVLVEYSNKGAYDVNDLRFYLTGYDPSIIPFGSYVAGISLPGKDQYNPQGSQKEFAKWTSTVRNFPTGIDSFKQEFTVTSCYHYQTTAIPNICVDMQNYGTSASNRCKFDIEGLGSSQGAPIAVTQVKPKVADKKIYLEIEFENKGNGVPFASPGSGGGKSTDSCHTSLQLNEIDTLRVSEVSMSGTRFSCNPEGIQRLSSKKGFMVCSGTISGSTYFITPLKIVLDYNYRQTISKQVSIVNLN